MITSLGTDPMVVVGLLVLVGIVAMIFGRDKDDQDPWNGLSGGTGPLGGT